jgi:hypothetical protein
VVIIAGVIKKIAVNNIAGNRNKKIFKYAFLPNGYSPYFFKIPTEELSIKESSSVGSLFFYYLIITSSPNSDFILLTQKFNASSGLTSPVSTPAIASNRVSQ